MPVLYADELEAASSSSTQATIDDNIANANSLNGTIDSFISNSGDHLVGEGWDSVRIKMQEYNNAFKEQTRVAERLGNAIEKVLNDLKKYMSDYEYLDSSQLPDLISRKSQLENTISYLEANVRTIKSYEEDNGNGTKVVKHETVYHEDIDRQLSVVRNNLEIIKDKIEKIRAMEEAYKVAEKELEEAYAEVQKFQNSVKRIVPSKVVNCDASN